MLIPMHTYSKVKKYTSDVIYQAKSDFESSLLKKLPENPKLFFNYCRNFTRSSSTVDTLKVNDQLLVDDTEKAEAFNKFFASVWTREQPLSS